MKVKLGAGRVLSDESGSSVGNVQQEVAGVFRMLSSEPGIELQLFCSSSTSHTEASRAVEHSLSAIIYGPMVMFDEVGKFLQGVGMYLQDPKDCDRNVEYRNPHRLSGLDQGAPMTLDLKTSPGSRPEEFLQSPVDIFSDLETTTFLAETIRPDCLATELYH